MERRALDPHGRTALHVAVQRRCAEAAKALVKRGWTGFERDAAGWSALQLAQLVADREIYQPLAEAAKALVEAETARVKPHIMEALRFMPDFEMHVEWRLDSMLLDRLVRRFSPSDTYVIRKRGDMMRVDMTLVGLDEEELEESQSSLSHMWSAEPWKRGSLSLYFNASSGAAGCWLANHGDQTLMDATKLEVTAVARTSGTRTVPRRTTCSTAWVRRWSAWSSAA